MDKVVTEMVDKLLTDLDSGKRSLKEVTSKVSTLAPGSSIASILVADSTIMDVTSGVIALDEAEKVIHSQADLHPAIPQLFLMCAMLAIDRESMLDGRGYLALAISKGEQYSFAEDVEEMLEEAGVEALAALSDEKEILGTVWPYVKDGCDHLVNHLLVQGISAGDSTPDPDELDMILARERQIVAILTGLCSDLTLEPLIPDPSDYLLYPIMLLGHFKDLTAVPPLLGALHICFGKTLHEAVLALAKVGSRHPEPVSVGLKEIAGNPDWGEDRLPTIEALGLLWGECENLEFLLDMLDSLDPADEDFQTMFSFLAWALLTTGQPEALVAVSASLEKHRDMCNEHVIFAVENTIVDFDVYEGKRRLNGLIEEDVREICCGPLSQFTNGARETLTLIREEEIDSEPQDGGEIVREIDELLKTEGNQPCPCGSGRKFKKCCLPQLEEEKRQLVSREIIEDEDTSDLMRLISQLFEFVRSGSVCSREEYESAEAEFLSPAGHEESQEVPESSALDLEHGLFLDWFLFSRPLDAGGRTVAEEFESTHGPHLPPDTRRTLRAIRGSTFSLFEVQKVFPGECLLVRDIFRDETLWIESEATSKTTYRWDILGMRTAPEEGRYYIYGMIFDVPRSYREEVEEYARGKCRELVSDGSVGGMDEFLDRKGYLLFHYVNGLKEKQPAPVLLTAEGDLLCISEAIFDVDDAPEVNRLLGEHPYIEEDEGERRGQARLYVWTLSPEMEDELRKGNHRDGPSEFERIKDRGPTGSMTIDDATGSTSEEAPARGLAMVTVTSKRLTLEASSRERLEYGKRKIENILPGLLTHRLDSLQDQAVLMEPAEEHGTGQVPGHPGREHQRLELERVVLGRHIEGHYKDWADRPLRALDGKTPRQAVNTESGRKEVDILLKDFENMVERHAGDNRPAYNFGSIREDLDVWPEVGDAGVRGDRSPGDIEPEDEYYLQDADFTDPDKTDKVMEKIGRHLRGKLESKPLPPGTRLRPALNKLPWFWTKGMCVELGLENPPRAPERVDALEEYLTRPGSIEDIWARLPEGSRRMLNWLVVEKLGFATVEKLSREFGPDDDSSWFWHAGYMPTSPLGLLRLNGLVFVGMATIKKRRLKIAAVPMELRREITLIASEPD
ncbi:MAG: SEC-C domain-containing protein [Actinomycetia bacterium]|nr:SEC-C domain-containing protein [Actinomycetes bacterium]